MSGAQCWACGAADAAYRHRRLDVPVCGTQCRQRADAAAPVRVAASAPGLRPLARHVPELCGPTGRWRDGARVIVPQAICAALECIGPETGTYLGAIPKDLARLVYAYLPRQQLIDEGQADARIGALLALQHIGPKRGRTDEDSSSSDDTEGSGLVLSDVYSSSLVLYCDLIQFVHETFFSQYPLISVIPNRSALGSCMLVARMILHISLQYEDIAHELGARSSEPRMPSIIARHFPPARPSYESYAFQNFVRTNGLGMIWADMIEAAEKRRPLEQKQRMADLLQSQEAERHELATSRAPAQRMADLRQRQEAELRELTAEQQRQDQEHQRMADPMNMEQMYAAFATPGVIQAFMRHAVMTLAATTDPDMCYHHYKNIYDWALARPEPRIPVNAAAVADLEPMFHYLRGGPFRSSLVAAAAVIALDGTTRKFGNLVGDNWLGDLVDNDWRPSDRHTYTLRPPATDPTLPAPTTTMSAAAAAAAAATPDVTMGH